MNGGMPFHVFLWRASFLLQDARILSEMDHKEEGYVWECLGMGRLCCADLQGFFFYAKGLHIRVRCDKLGMWKKTFTIFLKK